MQSVAFFIVMFDIVKPNVIILSVVKLNVAASFFIAQ
jgi:hypothetical protein